MLFRGKNFYITSFIICLFFAVVVKLTRSSLFGFNSILDIFLGSSPSFFYLFGIMSIIPLVQPKIKVITFYKSLLMLTIGALAYEIEQYWTSMFFDINDVVSTLLAPLTMLFLHRNERKPI